MRSRLPGVALQPLLPVALLCIAAPVAAQQGGQPAGEALAAAPAPAPDAAAAVPFRRHAHYVPMRDGVLLAVSIYRPVGESGDRAPTLLWLLPDRRETIDPRTGVIEPKMQRADIAFFNAHGYAIALAEMRGGGASFGQREIDRGPQIGQDGKDLVDWIAAQDWSDGKVGMIGASYQGFAQYATASNRPAALKAIFPEIAGFDDYGSMFHPGGILNVALSDYASGSIARMAQNRYDPARKELPSPPVIDEDGDGELADEIPLDRNGDGSFLDEGEPVYADGQPRKHLYYRATVEHAGNFNLTVKAIADAPYRDSLLGGTPYTYHDVDPGTKPVDIAQAGIAVYNRGGWFDYHARDTALWFATLKGRTPVHMMMAPTGHGGLPAHGAEDLYRAGPYFRLFGDTTTTNDLMNREKLRFFDRYVRGIDNGFDREDPVLLYVMGKGWRREKSWPLARAVPTRFYLGADHSLVARPGAAGTDQYRVDFTTSSISRKANRWNYGISRASEPMTLDDDAARRLAYLGAPLRADMEVTGHPLIELTLSSTASDGDIFVYLEDVAPDGSSLLVSEGQLRANYHRPRPIENMLAASARGFGVKPGLPWQGFDKVDYDPAPFADGKQVRLAFDLMPTSWVFRKGHRIRISIAGADAPSFAIHPALTEAAAKGEAPVWTLHRGAGLSSIELPVVPD